MSLLLVLSCLGVLGWLLATPAGRGFLILACVGLAMVVQAAWLVWMVLN